MAKETRKFNPYHKEKIDDIGDYISKVSRGTGSPKPKKEKVLIVENQNIKMESGNMLAWGIIAIISTVIFLSSMFAMFTTINSINVKDARLLAGLMWFSAPVASISIVIWFIYFIASFFA